MDKKVIPEAFHSGEYIRDELKARDWTQADLANILGFPPSIVSDVITGRRSISPEIATALGEAFNTSAQVWLNVQAAYQLAQESSKDDVVKRRAALYDKAPIREMQKRGWIESSSNVDILESQLCRFLEIDSIEKRSEFAAAARKSTDYKGVTPSQGAFLARVRQLARVLEVDAPYNGAQFNALLGELVTLLPSPEDIQCIPRVLANYGIRLLILEQIPGSKMDGACMWLDNDPTKPVVVVSLRYDRIDFFWHTLCHELCHVKLGEGLDHPLVEVAMIGFDAQPFDKKVASERKADRFAVEFLVNQAELEDFVFRYDPVFSRKAILGFSERVGTHPGLVVGQLQHRRKLPYSHMRALLVKVRDIITKVALTDGWGRTVAA